MFFDSWYGVLRVLVVGTLAYLALVAWLRLMGKRSVSKWNAFDLVVTVALGSTLASILLTEQVALVEGVVGMALLVMLQYAISWTSVRVGWVRQTAKNRPTLLLWEGKPRCQAMRRERVTEGELRAAVRSAGHASLENVDAIVLGNRRELQRREFRVGWFVQCAGRRGRRGGSEGRGTRLIAGHEAGRVRRIGNVGNGCCSPSARRPLDPCALRSGIRAAVQPGAVQEA